jgi:L-amino acid N-acyltransferase YncA
MLMETLLQRLRDAGNHMAIASITLPNPAAVALHESLGFEQVGMFREVGRKFYAWHDVGYWALDLEVPG